MGISIVCQKSTERFARVVITRQVRKLTGSRQRIYLERAETWVFERELGQSKIFKNISTRRNAHDAVSGMKVLSMIKFFRPDLI